MADLSDVTTYIASTVANVVYPNGASRPSIAPVPATTPTQTFTNPADVRIFEGWPLPDQLDLDLGGKQLATGATTPSPRPNGPMANVSIYSLPGANRAVYQILDATYIITPPTIDLGILLVGQILTVTGTGAAGEFLTVVADNEYIFSVSASGQTAAQVMSALLVLAQVQYPNAYIAGSTIVIPALFSLEARQGGTATLGKVTHRQCQEVMVTVWAPDHNTRSVLAAAIDNAIKQSIIVTLPDTSDMKIVYARTMVSDEHENVTAYRRDLIYDCEYATLELFAGYTVTSVSTTITAGEYAGATPPQVTVVTSYTLPPPLGGGSNAEPLGMP